MYTRLLYEKLNHTYTYTYSIPILYLFLHIEYRYIYDTQSLYIFFLTIKYTTKHFILDFILHRRSRLLSHY